MQSYEFYYYIFKQIDNVNDLINVSRASQIFDEILKDIKKEKIIKFKKMGEYERIYYYVNELMMYYYPNFMFITISMMDYGFSEDLFEIMSSRDRDLFYKDYYNLPYSFFKNRKKANKYRKSLKNNNYKKFKLEDKDEIYKRYHFACKILNASKEPKTMTIYCANILLLDSVEFENCS